MSEEERQNQPISEKRKAAFLRYMAILFAVAFILVLLSLILQNKSSKATISQLNEASRSALQNAVDLQEQNRSLQEENDALTAQIADLSQQLSDSEAVAAELAQAKAELEAAAEETAAANDHQLDHTVEAYEALLIAMQCDTQEGNVTFSRAADTVEKFKDCLGPRAQAAFEKLMTIEVETETDIETTEG